MQLFLTSGTLDTGAQVAAVSGSISRTRIGRTRLPGRVVVSMLILGCMAWPLRAQTPAATAGQPQAPAAAAPASPQSADAAQEPADSEPSMRKQVDEVHLDMAVHDKHRKPVMDLTASDLVVTDEGTLVKLNDLHLVKGATVRGHLVTLLFDPFSGPLAKQARNTATKVLKTFPAEGYTFSVLDFGGRVRLLQAFTDDRSLVEQAIAAATETDPVGVKTPSQFVNYTIDRAEKKRGEFAASAEKNLVAMARTGVDAAGHNVDVQTRAHAQMVLNALEDAQKIVQEQHTYSTLAGLLALVKAQRQAPERKAIVYFTRNSQMDTSAKEMLKTISAAAMGAGVTIYTVDLDAMNDARAYDSPNARGNAPPRFEPGKDLVAMTPVGPITVNRSQQELGTPIQGDLMPDSAGNMVPTWGTKQDIAVMTDFHRQSGDYAMFAYKKSPMIQLANDTGGIYLDVENGFKHGLQEMLEDMTTYYEATYVPPIKDYDGSYRTIAVKPVRKDLKVQAKNGYFAVAPGMEAGVRAFEVPLLKLLDGQELPTEVQFAARVIRFGDMPDGETSTVAIEVPIRGLKTKEDDSSHVYEAHAVVEARIRDSLGVQVERFGEDVVNRGALEELQRDRTSSILVARHFISAPGHYTMEVAVTDQFSGKTGARRVEFDVPQPGQSGLSDVVLVRKVDGIRPENDTDPVEPLRYENTRITPDVSGELPGTAKGVSLFFVLHPDAASKDEPTLEMQVIHDGRPGHRTPLPLRLNSAGMPIPYLAKFGAGALAPGDYKVVAYLNQGDKTSAQQVEFKVDAIPGTVASLNGAGVADAGGMGDAAAAAAKEVVEADIHTAGQLAIVPVTNPVEPLSADAVRALISDARERAIGYGDSLPNFICLQVTKRSVDGSGYGRWKLQDNIVEVLRYRDKKETRTTMEVNGKKSSADRNTFRGALSAGEFSTVLKSIFSDSAKADFVWKETDALNNGTVQVFNYKVEKANSIFSVSASNGRALTVGFHGQVFIDSGTHAVRRLSLIADDLPRAFPTHSTRIDVDYDYVAINEHDFLVPVTAELRLTQGRHQAVLNTMEFRNYHKYGSNVRILGYTPVEGDK